MLDWYKSDHLKPITIKYYTELKKLRAYLSKKKYCIKRCADCQILIITAKCNKNRDIRDQIKLLYL